MSMMDEQVPHLVFLGRYAGFVTRLVAFVIDRAVISIIVLLIVASVKYVLDAFAINQLFGFQDILPSVAAAFAVGAYVVVLFFYNIGFWMLAGQTPGKRLLGARIVRTDGGRVRFGNAVRRQIGYVISGMLFLGFLWILFDNRRQGFHDKLAGTYVVYSWPEEELRGTFVVDRVQRFRHKRQAAQSQKETS
jgi:uncharacterized RDD family membrane protein YckC